LNPDGTSNPFAIIDVYVINADPDEREEEKKKREKKKELISFLEEKKELIETIEDIPTNLRMTHPIDFNSVNFGFINSDFINYDHRLVGFKYGSAIGP